MAVPQSKLAWQPSRLACVVAGVFCSVIILAALVFMFSRPPESVIRVNYMQIRLESTAAAKYAIPERAHSRAEQQPTYKPIPHLSRLATPRKIPLPKSIDWQQQIDMAVKSDDLNRSNPSGFILNAAPSDQALQHALNAPRKQTPMQDGESYRSIYGGTMLESNGVCSELQTIQIGPSPSNRVTLAFPGRHCAGDYRPSLGDELLQWADQQAQKRKHRPPH